MGGPIIQREPIGSTFSRISRDLIGETLVEDPGRSRSSVGAHPQWVRSATPAPSQHHAMANIGREQVAIWPRLSRRAAKGRRSRQSCYAGPPPAVIVVGSAALFGLRCSRDGITEAGKGPMADRHALKLIGIMFAALTLMVISTAAVVVAGYATGLSGEYSELAGSRD